MAENIDFDEIDTHHDLNVEETKEGHHLQPQNAKQVKKPQSAFALYMQENKEQLKKELQKIENFKQTMFLSEASKKWNALDPLQKQKYIERAQQQKEAYNHMIQQEQLDPDGEGAVGEELNQMRSNFTAIQQLQGNLCSCL